MGGGREVGYNMDEKEGVQVRGKRGSVETDRNVGEKIFGKVRKS